MALPLFLFSNSAITSITYKVNQGKYSLLPSTVQLISATWLLDACRDIFLIKPDGIEPVPVLEESATVVSRSGVAVLSDTGVDWGGSVAAVSIDVR
jgi:hypothetical protein